MVSALAHYFKTGDETNINTEVPSISGKLNSEHKKTVMSKEPEQIRKMHLKDNELQQHEYFNPIHDPSLRNKMIKTLEHLKGKHYDYTYTPVDSRSFILSFTNSNHLSSGGDLSLRLKVTRLEDPDYYKLETEGIDPSTFRELIRCVSAALPDIIESLVSMSDQNCQ